MVESDIKLRPTFNIALLLFALMNAAIHFACVHAILRYGWPIGIELVALACCLTSFSGFTALRQLSNRPWTIVEVLTVVANCVILHGLAMPTVSSGPHRIGLLKRPLLAESVPCWERDDQLNRRIECHKKKTTLRT